VESPARQGPRISGKGDCDCGRERPWRGFIGRPAEIQMERILEGGLVGQIRMVEWFEFAALEQPIRRSIRAWHWGVLFLLLSPLLDLQAERAGMVSVEGHLQRLADRLLLGEADEHAHPGRRLQHDPVTAARGEHCAQGEGHTNPLAEWVTHRFSAHHFASLMVTSQAARSKRESSDAARFPVNTRGRRGPGVLPISLLDPRFQARPARTRVQPNTRHGRSRAV